MANAAIYLSPNSCHIESRLKSGNNVFTCIQSSNLKLQVNLSTSLSNFEELFHLSKRFFFPDSTLKSRIHRNCFFLANHDSRNPFLCIREIRSSLLDQKLTNEEINVGHKFLMNRRSLVMASLGCLTVVAPESISGTAEAIVFESPIERAIIATLNAKEVLPFLCSKAASTVYEVQIWHRAVSELNDSLKVNLPVLVNTFGLDREAVGEILWDLSYAKKTLAIQGAIFAREGEEYSISGSTDQAQALLKISLSGIEYLLNEVPEETIEMAQLARGIRPSA